MNGATLWAYADECSRSPCQSRDSKMVGRIVRQSSGRIGSTRIRRVSRGVDLLARSADALILGDSLRSALRRRFPPAPLRNCHRP
jgi:hypothetical protein